MKNVLPDWVNPTLQGLAFWMGYQDQYYRHYPLSESAIVTESCRLIHAQLDKGDKLLCEVQYKNICNGTRGSTIAGQKRADLVKYPAFNGVQKSR